MVYKKKFKIEGKIISKDDLIRLIQKLCDRFDDKNIKNFKLRITVRFVDDTTLEDDNISIFDKKIQIYM